MHNLYGPTEAAVDVTFWACRRDDPRSFVPIGRPIANTQIYILDQNLSPVPIGIPGELHIGGIGLARGYLNRPELTADRFIPDAVSKRHGARLYKTGDLSRYLPSGEIQYLGRIDSQVKIRGFRIELGEIGAVLAKHPGVKQCVVTAREDTPGEKMLVAYFESQGDAVPESSALRAYLKKEIPEYMVPSTFVHVAKLPLSPNGKIDVKALPAPNVRSLETKTGFVAARDPIEQVLAHLWSKVLKVKRVGLHDNFFELGGHSLLAVRIIVEVEKIYGRRLPLATLLQAPTVGALAEVLRRENWQPSWSSLVPLQPGGSKTPLFLIHSHGGNVLEYYPLANHLGKDQPVYALQARGLDGNIVKNQTLAGNRVRIPGRDTDPAAGGSVCTWRLLFRWPGGARSRSATASCRTEGLPGSDDSDHASGISSILLREVVPFTGGGIAQRKESTWSKRIWRIAGHDISETG